MSMLTSFKCARCEVIQSGTPALIAKVVGANTEPILICSGTGCADSFDYWLAREPEPVPPRGRLSCIVS